MTAYRIVPEGGWAFPRFKGRSEPRVKPARKHGHKGDPAHLRLIRQLPCLVTGSMVNVEAAHVRMSEDSFGKVNAGHSAKPADEWTVPLNHDEHMRQHSMGEREYWQSVGINPLKVAQQLYGISQALRESRVPEEDIVRHMTGIVVRARNEAS